MALSRLMSVAKSSPILTASVQTGTLMCVGDVFCQKFIEKKEWDMWRTARFGTIGFFFVGPVLRTWFGFLDARIVFNSRIKTALGRVVVDQTFMPPALLGSFIVINSGMQGKSWDKIKGDFSATYKDILVANYQLWPAVQLINFAFVPLQYRVLLVQTVALAFNTYLSWKTNGAHSAEKSDS